MKKSRMLLFIPCLAMLCSATALAAEQPVFEDFATAEEYEEAYLLWYTAQVQQVDAAQGEPTSEPEEQIKESAEANYADSRQPVEDNPPAKYPVGSYVDPSGAVWSPDGARLSPLSAESAAPAASSDKNDTLSFQEPSDSSDLSDAADPDPLAVTVSDSPAMWYVEDLRPSDAPVTVLDGLKGLVTSIFGEYTPVTTTSVVTQTVGSDTYQYLVETVAPGAAGVDYEWVAGVALFGVMLFCFLKLLGGILK